MIAGRNVFDDDGGADVRVSLCVSDDDRWAVNDGSSLDALRQRWAAEARASGRIDVARALEGHDDPADIEDQRELLAAFRRDVEREFVLVQLHAEAQGDDLYRGPR